MSGPKKQFRRVWIDGKMYVDRNLLALIASLPVSAIRNHCVPDCYAKDGRALYDAQRWEARLVAVARRREEARLTKDGPAPNMGSEGTDMQSP